MPEKAKDVDMLKFDSRLIDYNLNNRVLTLEEYESYLKALPEEAEFDWTPVLDEELADTEEPTTPSPDTPSTTNS